MAQKGTAIMGYKKTRYISNYSQFGNVLAKIREERKYSQYQVGEAIGMDRKTISNYEMSDGNYGSIKGLLLMLKEYGVKPNDFFIMVEEASRK